MTMDRTLKIHGGLGGRRSVMTRAERIAHLTEEGKFDPESDSPLGLPKTRIRQSRAGKKAKKAEEPEAAETLEGAEATEGAAETQTTEGD
ncbi:MAG: small basic protein [Phycisphaerae bacterium]|nr:small basic protein [Phycisphaerae bacterium]